MIFCRRQYMVRVSHDSTWKQIDTIEYLNRSTTTKFISASFKSCTIKCRLLIKWNIVFTIKRLSFYSVRSDYYRRKLNLFDSVGLGHIESGWT